MTYLMKMGLYNKSEKSKADHKFLCQLWWVITPRHIASLVKGLPLPYISPVRCSCASRLTHL